MSCKEYQELISASLDGELSAEERKALDLHLRSCAECRAELELESSLKRLVRERLPILQTPPAVAQKIRERLQQGGRAAAGSWLDRLQDYLSRPLVRPAIAIAATAIVLYLILRPTSVDFIQQSVANFQAVVDGSFSLPLQKASGEPALLKALLSEQSDFPVMVPEMQGCELLGGVLDKHPNGAFAHVVYYHGMKAKKVYLYQTNWEKAMAGEGMTIAEDVRQKLTESNYYTRGTPEGQTIIVWRKGETLCSAVSDMPEPDLLMCLTSVDPTLLQR